MPYLKYLTHANVLTVCFCLLSACGGGAPSGGENKVSPMQSMETLDPVTESSTTTNIETPIVTTPVVTRPTSTPINLVGTITYDRILFNARLYKGLDYSSVIPMPARGVTVLLLNTKGTSVQSTVTNAAGEYQFSAVKNTDYRIRVVAELEGNNTANWSIRVKDNTNANALYVMDGSLVSSGENPTQTRNLHAESGWDGSDYSQARSAAPFAVLDSIYDAVSAMVSASPNVVLPPLDIYWSESNIAVNGNLSEGKIGTSFYTSAGPSIYLLGAKNNDSDEYDRAVIQHEFGHYVEHQLSRTESLGGSHNVNSLLDLRVAFGEAWGNAFSAMVSGDPVYRDSLGNKQALGFSINVEQRGYGFQGWFSEGSIQSILYNLFDNTDDQSDSVSLGFKPFLDVLTSDEYLEHEGFASIYPFIEVLKRKNPEKTTEIQQLVNSYNIYGTGFYGDSETNSGGSQSTLPVYNSLSVGKSVNVCSDSEFQNYNGVDIYRLIRFSVPSRRTYNFSASKSSSALTSTNPQMRIHQKGHQVASFTGSAKNIEVGSTTLNAGTYILEVFEQSNSQNDNNSGGLACFNVSIN